MRVVAAEHGFTLEDAGWDAIAALIADFQSRVAAGLPATPERFDEAFYREVYPDVDQAILAGTCLSGQAHFQAHGRAEGRGYLVLREP